MLYQIVFSSIFITHMFFILNELMLLMGLLIYIIIRMIMLKLNTKKRRNNAFSYIIFRLT